MANSSTPTSKSTERNPRASQTAISSTHWPQVLFITGLILTITMTIPMILIVPVTFLPTILLYTWYTYRRTSANAMLPGRKLLQVYLLSGVLMVAVIIYQTICSLIVGSLLFGDELESYMKEFYRSEGELKHADPETIAKRAHMASRPSYFVFLFVMCFDIIGFSEELLKYIAIPLSARYILSPPMPPPVSPDEIARVDAHARESLLGQTQRPSQSQSYTDALSARITIPIAVTTALGFSMLENIGFLLGARDDTSRLLLTMAERLVLSAPGHLLSAVYIGIMCARAGGVDESGPGSSSSAGTGPGIWTARLVRWLRILALPILFHGTFDFLLLGISAWNGNIGWVHPRSGPSLWVAVGGILGLSLTFAVIVRRKWMQHGVIF